MARKRGPGGRNQWRKVKTSSRRPVALKTDRESSRFWGRADRNYLIRCIDCGRLAIAYPDAVCNVGHDDRTYEHGGVCDYCLGQWSWDGTTGVGPKS
jgi:hypothetical protein